MDLKAGALSLTRFLGQPNLLRILSRRKMMITLFVALHLRNASTHWQLKSTYSGNWNEDEFIL